MEQSSVWVGIHSQIQRDPITYTHPTGELRAIQRPHLKNLSCQHAIVMMTHLQNEGALVLEENSMIRICFGLDTSQTFFK